MVIQSPSFTVVFPTVNFFAFASILIASAPQTAGMPSPRATTAACELVPPAEVRMP
jgi:hypothetical protein